MKSLFLIIATLLGMNAARAENLVCGVTQNINQQAPIIENGTQQRTEISGSGYADLAISYKGYSYTLQYDRSNNATLKITYSLDGASYSSMFSNLGNGVGRVDYAISDYSVTNPTYLGFLTCNIEK